MPLNAVATLSTGVGPLTDPHLASCRRSPSRSTCSPACRWAKRSTRQELARETLPDTSAPLSRARPRPSSLRCSGMGMLLALAILVIYMVLGILYESFIHPITILSGLPSAGLGALATLLIFHDELNIYSFVGVIMLIGIVKKNAIMMIDFALEAQRTHGTPPAEAIVEACLVRFRPIMMTTMAALVGTLPIALGLGAGGEARRPHGSGGGGRPGGFAAADTVHHAGVLHLHGTVRERRQEAQGPQGGQEAIAAAVEEVALEA